MGIEIDDTATPGLSKIGNAIEQPPLVKIASAASDSARARLKAGGPAPSGVPWTPTRNRANGLLYLTGALANSLEPSGSGDDAVVTSTLPYAQLHNEGGTTRARTIRAKNGVLRFPIAGGFAYAKTIEHPGGNYPAREFIGIGAAEEQAISDVLDKHIEPSS